MLEGTDLRQAAVAHADPAKLVFARQFRARYPPRLDEATGVGAVIRTGKASFYPHIPDELLAAGARDDEHLRLIRELQMRSVIIVPMRGRERVVGAITFVAAESAGAFDETDLAFAQEFANRAAVAVENARLYRERSLTARTLQRSLLPARLPKIDGWQVATRYRAAERSAQIGGDFFDLFCTDDAFTVVIGDVTGKGVAAATLTALTRHSARTCALLGLSPSELLQLLNRELVEQPALSLVTAVVARFARQGEKMLMTVASAGHPLPLRHRREGAAGEVGRPGVLLGFDADGNWPEQTISLEPGDTLLFYTDGVTDTLGTQGRFGEARLRELVSRSPVDPEAMLQKIDHTLREFQIGTAQDDTAMLAVHLLEEQAPAGAPVGAEPAELASA
jgi:serine phosphatase RsbU (regulator of sigma subunit)